MGVSGSGAGRWLMLPATVGCGQQAALPAAPPLALRLFSGFAMQCSTAYPAPSSARLPRCPALPSSHRKESNNKAHLAVVLGVGHVVERLVAVDHRKGGCTRRQGRAGQEQVQTGGTRMSSSGRDCLGWLTVGLSGWLGTQEPGYNTVMRHPPTHPPVTVA